MGAGFTQEGSFFVPGGGAFVAGGSGGLPVNPFRDFTSGATGPLPFNPTIDLAFSTGQYFGVTGAPTSFLTTTNSGGLAVDSNGNWTTFGVNTPRITNLGLLVEESRTNLVLQSAALAGGWATNQTTIVLGQVSPDGGTNAVSITDNSTGGTPHYFYGSSSGITTVAGTTYAFSAFFKAGTGGFAGISFANGGFASGFYACANLQTGAITTSGLFGAGTLISASAQLYPNGWVRITAVGTPGSTGPTFPILSVIQNAAGTPLTNYAGTGSTILAWQPQAEAGAVTTSPIRTTSAAVTRAADVVTLTSPPAFVAAYTLFANIVPQSPTSNVAAQVFAEANDGTATNAGAIYRVAGTGAAAAFLGGTGGTASTSAVNGALGLPILTQNVSAKMASAITGASGLNHFYIGSSPAGQQADGLISRVALWPTTALTGAQLQQITT